MKEKISLKQTDPQLYELIIKEEQRQREQLQLIPSENYASKAVLAPLASVLSNKYSEGYPGKRYYQGNKFIDQIEKLAQERLKRLYQAEYANIQPFSGAPANFAVYLALLKPGEKILAMDLASGGHLSHGAKVNLSGQLYQTVFYNVNPQTEKLDYDEIEEIAKKERPQLIIAGATAYPREINFARFGEIARKVGAYLMVDMAHIAGLVAAKVHPDPVPHADVITATTHKTLRGPRGAFILARSELGPQIDRAVFPGGIQAGPHNHVQAAKAVCFYEALQPQFKDYARQVIKNAAVLAQKLQEKGYRLVSGGTDNHLLLIDLRPQNIDGRTAALALEEAGIIVNKNKIPFDPGTAVKPSGIRLGSPAVTSRGMKEAEMEQIASWIDQVLQNYQNKQLLEKIRREVVAFASSFPVPGLDS